MSLPIYIPTRGMPERLHSARLLRDNDVEFTLVVDNKDQRAAMRKLGFKAEATLLKDTLLVNKRNFILEKMQKRGFMVMMDDNIQAFTRVADPFMKELVLPVDDGTNWRPIYRTPCSPSRMMKAMDALAAKCAKEGAAYGGVATTENPFFRAKRYGYRRFVKSKICVIDASSKVRFKHMITHDSYASALAVALYGKVIVDSFYHYNVTWYEKGGLGSRKDREALGLNDFLAATCKEFPGLVGLARGQNSALRFLLTSEASVTRWRQANGYL